MGAIYATGVQVTVRLFAGIREQAGTGERPLELADGAHVADVWAALGLGEQPPGLLFAVNRAYVRADAILSDGDEVALIPPVSGGSNSVSLSETPIDPAAVIAEAADVRAGAVATFLGTTRVESRGRSVVRLEYEAYEGMTESIMSDLAAELETAYDLCKVAITHRVGVVGIGEISVAIAVSAPHRADALAACKDAIDRLKETAPVWKKEFYEDGEEWIGRGS
jgi:molybdopterin converting factor subunit 1